jgi:uncharacterized protein YndB with AHSA1/START domain
MARNEVFIDAPPETVFGLLSDASTYAVWVVGSREIRSSDRDWPARGARFAHTIGVPPVVIKDDTTVVDSRPPARLELHARARPFPSARITFELVPERGGTRVTVTEDVSNAILNLLVGPLGHAAIRLRNRETLRRLKALATGAVRSEARRAIAQKMQGQRDPRER